MRLSLEPVSCGFRVRLMSPLGTYPDKSLLYDDAALIVEDDICFSIVRIVEEDWGFSEVDSLSPLDIPLFGSLLLCKAGYPYPFGGIDLAADEQKPLDPNHIAECREHLARHIKEYRSSQMPSAIIHRPPLHGGNSYQNEHFGDIRRMIAECMTSLQKVDAVLQRGMAWTHGEFADAACIFLWIALDGAHSATLHRSRTSGIRNPTSKDASAYLNSVIGFETPWEKFFEEDYENRIRTIHPDSRFGAEIRPQILADDFYELRHLLIPYFRYLITGVYDNPDVH